MRAPRGNLTQAESNADRPQTRGAAAWVNKYFYLSALGITLARQTADRGLRKQQASPAEQNALSLASRFPLVALLCACCSKNRRSAAVPSFEFLAPPYITAGFCAVLNACLMLGCRLPKCEGAMAIDASRADAKFNIRRQCDQACSAHLRAAAVSLSTLFF